MSNRNVGFLVTLAITIAVAGFLANWWMAAGIFIGLAVMAAIYQRRYSVIDEIETEVGWVRNWGPEKLDEYGSEYTRWCGFWRPLLVTIIFVAVFAVIVMGIAGS